MQLLGELRNWLKANGKSREWLAAEVGISKHTIDGWFAGRPITKSAKPNLERLIKGAPSVEYRTTLNQAARIIEAAKEDGMEPMEWVDSVVLKVLNERRR